jgi:cobalt-zinc-cadmium efflux system protein
VLALCLTLGYAVVETIGGLLTGSLALLGDAGHMLSDSLALGFAALAAKIAARPPSEKHSYGLGRIEALSALANAVLMLAIVIGIGWEAAERLRNPQPIEAGTATIVAVVGLFVNIGAAWLLSRGERTLNMRAALIHVIGDLLGSVAAIAALLIVKYTGWTAADPLLSLLIGGLILASTFNLLRDTLHQLLDGVPRELSLANIGRRLAELPGVSSVHDLHVWSFGPGRVALSAHLVMGDAPRWSAVLVAARHMIETEFGIRHVTLQPELPGDPSFPLARLTRPDPRDRAGLPAEKQPPLNRAPSDAQGLPREP